MNGVSVTFGWSYSLDEGSIRISRITPTNVKIALKIKPSITRIPRRINIIPSTAKMRLRYFILPRKPLPCTPLASQMCLPITLFASCNILHQ